MKFDKLAEAYMNVVKENTINIAKPKLTPENIGYLYIDIKDGKSSYITKSDGDHLKAGIKSIDSRYNEGRQGARIWKTEDWVLVDLSS